LKGIKDQKKDDFGAMRFDSFHGPLEGSNLTTPEQVLAEEKPSSNCQKKDDSLVALLDTTPNVWRSVLRRTNATWRK
jgi:hypothetical protein